MIITAPPRTNLPEFDIWMEQFVSLFKMDAGELRIGDDITGNYTAIEADGTLEFNGDATVWDDLKGPLVKAKAPVADFPTYAQVADDGAGSVGTFGYYFADGEYLFVTHQIPHDWKEGSTIYPHIHFETTSDVDPADNFKFGYEYTWTNITADRAATTSGEDEDISTGVDSDTMHQIANIPTAGIAGTGKTISSIIVFRIYRAAAVGDNYADDVIITDFDIHYEKDTIGSRGVVSK